MRVTTALELRLYTALKRITAYAPPERLKRRAEQDYGLSPNEAVEMAYDNLQSEARAALQGVRLPKNRAS